MRIAAAVLLSVLAGGAAGAAPLPNPHGWAKPGVSYLQFRTDTVECGYAAAQVKMPAIVGGSAPSLPVTAVAAPPTSAAAAIAGGSLSRDQLDMIESYVENYQQYTEIVEKQVADRVQAELDKCLVGRGYRPFKVTSKQMGQLRKLHMGTRERYFYIYELGTDPAVLANQGL